LDQGCGLRHACSEAGGELGAPPRAHDTAAGTPVSHRPRSPNVGKYGEKTADGKPKPDDRTVADLVRRGWFESEQAVVTELTKLKSQKERYPYETAGPVADWLAARLAAVPAKDGVCAAARAIRRFPNVLTMAEETLQRGWDMLLRPQAEGGLACTPERAALLLSTRSQVFAYTPEHILKSIAILEDCGMADGIKAITRQPQLLCMSTSALLERAAWWRQTGLDYKKILTVQPALMCMPPSSMQFKLDFLRNVVGTSDDTLNMGATLFSYSLDGRLRPRFFYALRMGTAQLYSMNTLMHEADPSFVAYALGRSGRLLPASAAEVASYKQTVASAEFIAWSQREEALRMRAKS
jgi:hypothetical protein